MKKTYICLKDQPVLEISSYSCRILDYDRLPVSPGMRAWGLMMSCMGGRKTEP